MKTAMQELWEMLDDAENNGVFEVGTQNFKRYIEGIYLEKEKHQIINAYALGSENIYSYTTGGEKYYSETFKQ